MAFKALGRYKKAGRLDFLRMIINYRTNPPAKFLLYSPTEEVVGYHAFEKKYTFFFK